MTDRHRLIVDRHEQEHTVVEVDGLGHFDLPRSFLPSGTRGDDVFAVTVDADDQRAVITVTRDADATANAKARARAALERLANRNPGGEVEL